MKISIVVATNLNDVIGSNNQIPWKSREDLRHFKQLTTGHFILMGRKTFESIGKALPDRTNIVLSRDENFSPAGCQVFNNIEDAIKFTEEKKQQELFVIGGEQIYNETLPQSSNIYQTLVLSKESGDSFFPKLDEEEWKEVSKEEHLGLNPPIIFRNLERR